MKRLMALILILFLAFGASSGVLALTLKGLDLNEALLRDKGIRVYGEPGDIPYNEFVPVARGYYTYQGREGEFRYHGFDGGFNPFTNREFPNDADSYRALSMKNWLKEGWLTRGFSPDPFQSYLRGERGLAADFLKEAYEGMLPFEIYKEGPVYDYLYISDFPTLYGPGQGILWHETGSGFWYQSFSLGALEAKLATPGEVTFIAIEEKAYDLGDLSKGLEVTLHGRLLDEEAFTSPVLGALHYTREDIEDLTFTLGDQTRTLPPNDLANSGLVTFRLPLSPLDMAAGEVALTGAFRVNYRDGSHSPWFTREVRYGLDQTSGYLQSCFNVGPVAKTSDLTLEDIAYHDLSKGDIDFYTITLASVKETVSYDLLPAGIDFTVKNLIHDYVQRNDFEVTDSFHLTQQVTGDLGTSTFTREVGFLQRETGLDLEFILPESVYDLQAIEAKNLTPLAEVVEKKVTLGGEELDFDAFFRGGVVYGEVAEDELVAVAVTLKTAPGTVYTYQDWILVKSTVPTVNFQPEEKAVEGRWVRFVDRGGREALNRDFPVTYAFQAGDLEIRENDQGFEVLAGTPGVHTLRVTAKSDINAATREYRLPVAEDQPPGIYVNLYSDQIFRGDPLLLESAFVSLDGDMIEDTEMIIEKDPEGDGTYVYDGVYDPERLFESLGDYRLVVRASEDRESAEVLRPFKVDNRMPITTLSLVEATPPPRVDLVLVGEEEGLPPAGEIEETLRQRGYEARVAYFDPAPVTDTRTVTRDLRTGRDEPPPSLDFSEEGYRGTLTLNQVQDLGAYEEEGHYAYRTSCKSVPVYSRVRGCDICGTYYNALGHKFCKFCMVVTGTTTQCTRKKYWVSQMVWHPDYLGTYSGEVTGTFTREYVDGFREGARTRMLLLEGVDPGPWETRAHEVLSVAGEDVLAVIEALYPREEAAMTTVLAGEAFDLSYGNHDAEGDPVVREEFMVRHDPGIFDNPSERDPSHGLYGGEEPAVFNRPGHYEIFRRIRDRPPDEAFAKFSGEASVHLKVHRPPVADFHLQYQGGWQLVDLSYDPDYVYQREDRGIATTRFLMEDGAGEKWYRLPEEIPPGTYRITYGVEDVDGAGDQVVREVEMVEDPVTLWGEVFPAVLPITEVVTLRGLVPSEPGGMAVAVVSQDKRIRLPLGAGLEAGESVTFRIPEDFRDMTYHFEVTLKGRTFFFPFRVHSPIELALLPPAGDEVRARVAPYVREVYLLKEGRLIPMTLTEGVYGILTRREEGLRVRGVLHDKQEEVEVVFPRPAGDGPSITLTGSWQYWRGQENLLGSRMTLEPHRFMAFEQVTLTVTGLEGEGVVAFDPALGLDPVPFVDSCERVLTLPLLPSSLGYDGVRRREPYWIRVTRGEEIYEKSFEITGNIYDRIYLQPDF